MMPPETEPIECARLPAASLALLAGLRRVPGVTVTVTTAGERAWVRWDPASTEVLESIRPIPGAELYVRRGGLWYRLGHRLPAFDVPADDAGGMPLHRALVPLPVRPESPGDAAIRAVELALVPDATARPATAMECSLGELAAWIEMAPAARIEPLRAARAGDRVLVLGRPLPPMPGARRFWGRSVLTPLGLRPEPALPEPSLCEALGAAGGEVLILTTEGTEAVPLAAFRPLTRAGIRLAHGGHTP
ncbi:hypothetical protein OJF2_45390 [Aquisphaera giovannonii]|uniref:MoxR-vWA-beta-propeller ternary system domain-containing protein n=1 Tax=Aquisphaera giovannonii TaxID=406548 RepID=A0A5B9W7I8_9BACT|nr:hypothetical protein [Aquisphaera giovannonii]QEH35981.1 hypothetical protein OJF2_45390 [Aquisphaera giovannonii]